MPFYPTILQPIDNSLKIIYARKQKLEKHKSTIAQHFSVTAVLKIIKE